jgi:hypothetical protein
MSTSAATGQTGDQFTFWQARLRGENPDHTPGRAEAGYWRIRQRDGSVVPIFLWREEGTDRLCIVYNLGQPRYVEEEEAFCERTFAYALRNPVTSDAYKHFKEHQRWPEDVPNVAAQVENRLNEISGSMGHNAPPEVVIEETVKELRAEAERWLEEIGGEIISQEHADKAANFADRFAELERDAEKTRVAEKEPHLKASREVDNKWQPIKKAADAAKRWAKGLPEAFLRAERARKAAEAVAKAAEGQAINPDDLKVKAGTRGRSVSLRGRKILKVTDPNALWDTYVRDERFRNDPDVQSALHRLAFGDLQLGQTVLGAEIVTQESAK